MSRSISRPNKMTIALTLEQYELAMTALEELAHHSDYPDNVRQKAWDLYLDLEDSQAIRIRELKKRQRLYDNQYKEKESV